MINSISKGFALYADGADRDFTIGRLDRPTRLLHQCSIPTLRIHARRSNKDSVPYDHTPNADEEIAIRAVRIQSEALRDAIDHAYLDTYNTPGALKYAKDLSRAKSRATTIEL